MLPSSSIRQFSLALGVSLAATGLIFTPVSSAATSRSEPPPVRIGDVITLEGTAELDPDPPIFGAPGLILENLSAPLHELLPDGQIQRIEQLLLLVVHLIPPAARTDGTTVTVNVRVTGRYARLMGAPSIIVTEIVIDGVVVPPPPSRDIEQRKMLARNQVQRFLRDGLPLASGMEVHYVSTEVLSREHVNVDVRIRPRGSARGVKGTRSRFLYLVGEDEVRPISDLLSP
jgi:hypothetical protein